MVSPNPQPGVTGHRLPDSVAVRVTDAQGRPVAGVPVQFVVTSGGGRVPFATGPTSAAGVARAIWILGEAEGPQHLEVRAGALAAVRLEARATRVAAPLAGMLAGLGDYISNVRTGLEATIGQNPQIASFIQGKIAMLQQPALAGAVIAGERFGTGTVAARGGRTIPLGGVFPAEAMRSQAAEVLGLVESTVPTLEDFLALPYPVDTVRVWVGFDIGNAGGGGRLYLEDRGTYEARSPATRFPYDAVVGHELAHTFVSHESLTQFLELYAYNIPRSGSPDPRTWGHTRGYTPGRATNEGVHALLDVYTLLGPEAMAAAYRAAIPLRPLYGQPLAPAVRQAFVDAAPAELRAQVAAAMERVRT